MLRPQSHRQLAAMEGIQALDALPLPRRKRKADVPDNNERLSKRLSLLNLGTSPPRPSLPSPLGFSVLHGADSPGAEQGGQRLYVPVESPGASPRPRRDPQPARVEPANESMELDDTRHKVYIYNLDDELSSESEAEDGKLVFLSDIEKHLRANRIPPSVLANSDGELAGMQLVLYSEPSALTVPREQDSVRKAVIEARARMRDKQRGVSDATADIKATAASVPPASPTARPRGPPRIASDFRLARSAVPPAAPPHDPDAMDLD